MADRKKLDPKALDVDSLDVEELDQVAGGTDDVNKNCYSCTCPTPPVYDNAQYA